MRIFQGMVAAVVLLVMSACQSNPSSAAQLVGVLPQSVSASQVVSVRITVSAPNLPARTLQLSLDGGQWTGRFESLPAGGERDFRAQAFDEGGKSLFQGQALGITLSPGQTALIAMTLQEVSPPDPFQNSTPYLSTLVASGTSVEPGGTLSLRAIAEDPDVGDSLTVRWGGTAGTFSASESFTTSWTAPATPGDVRLEVVISDSQGASAALSLWVSVQTSLSTAAVRVSFNSWPRVTRMTAHPATVVSGEMTSLQVSTADGDGDSVSLSWGASCDGSWSNATATSIQFRPSVTPSTAGCTRCSVTVTARDSRGGSGTGTLALCVGQPPVLALPPVITEVYQDAVSLPASGIITARVSAREPRGGTMFFSWQTSHGTVSPSTGTETSSQVSWTLPRCVPAGTQPTLTATVRNTLSQTTSTTFQVLDIPLCRWVTLAPGDHHVLALRSDGSMWAWGGNRLSELGDGTSIHRPTPVQVQVEDNPRFTAIAAGHHHALAVDSEGNLWSWGDNSYGRLGDGTTIKQSRPRKVAFPGGRRLRAVAAGVNHSLAVAGDDSVWAWGANNRGQLGTGQRLTSITPVRISALDGRRIIAVAAGSEHSLALGADGVLWAWGFNETGQVGNGTVSDQLVPVAVLTQVTSMAAGLAHTVARLSNGRVWRWGDIWRRDLAPVQMPDLSNVRAISAAGVHSLAVLDDGSVRGWGGNWGGQLTGTNPADLQCESGCVISLPGRAKQVYAAYQSSLALLEDNTVWGWGENDLGQLGNGLMAQRGTAVRVSALSGIVSAATGRGYSLAVHADGSVWSWGGNWHKVLGTEENKHRPHPEQLLSLPATTAVSGGFHHAFALPRFGGGLWTWPPLSQLPTLPQTVTQISAGGTHKLALGEGGSVWAWGDNSNGELGDGTYEYREVPTLVLGLPTISAISGGWGHSLALDREGSIWAWGRNDTGQLGDGSRVARNHPARVALPVRIKSISAGSMYSLALDENHYVWVWGANYSGQLGVEPVSNQWLPIRNPYLSDIVEIAAGHQHSLARRRDGVVFAWGNNTWSQVGEGLPHAVHIPTPRGGNFTHIYTGSASDHSLALDVAGNLWAWGSNSHGQFGNGEYGFSPEPVRTLLP
jgi:alpha-tubulin suppressor-like RCC1 family protein